MILTHRMAYVHQRRGEVNRYWAWYARHTIYFVGIPVLSWYRLVEMKVY